MNKITIMLLFVASLAGCVSVDSLPPAALHTLSTSITAQGEQQFTYFASMELPSYARGLGMHNTHMKWLGIDLAEARYCMNGYIIDTSKQTGDGFMYYTGHCK